MTMLETISQSRRIHPEGDGFQLVGSGRDYFTLLVGLILEARETIHLQTYIFAADETGSLIADALKAAAQRNVRVYLFVDGYASKHLSTSFINELTAKLK